MKLKNLLKQQGWTDDQIAAAFADPNTLTALDNIFGTVESERDTLKARNDEWQRKLDEEYNPRIGEMERKAMAAERRSADLEFQVKAAKEFGYLDDDAAKRAEESARAVNARNGGDGDYDPKRHPTFDDVAKFAEGEAEAIALMADLASQVRYYTGKDAHEYETQFNGQTMTGMRALRQEAKLARKPMDQFVSEKFDFAGKRRARAEEAAKAHDDQIRKEAVESTRREMAGQIGSPMLAYPMASRVPFMPAKSTEGKQPWERGTSQDRKVERIQNAMKAQVAGPVQ